MSFNIKPQGPGLLLACHWLLENVSMSGDPAAKRRNRSSDAEQGMRRMAELLGRNAFGILVYCKRKVAVGGEGHAASQPWFTGSFQMVSLETDRSRGF